MLHIIILLHYYYYYYYCDAGFFNQGRIINEDINNTWRNEFYLQIQCTTTIRTEQLKKLGNINLDYFNQIWSL